MTTEISASTLDQFIWEMVEKYRNSGNMEEQYCFICRRTGKIGPGPDEVCTHIVFEFWIPDMVKKQLEDRFEKLELIQLLYFIAALTDFPQSYLGVPPDEQIGDGDSWEGCLSWFLACQIVNIMFTRVPELKGIDAKRRELHELRWQAHARLAIQAMS